MPFYYRRVLYKDQLLCQLLMFQLSVTPDLGPVQRKERAHGYRMGYTPAQTHMYIHMHPPPQRTYETNTHESLYLLFVFSTPEKTAEEPLLCRWNKRADIRMRDFVGCW